MLEEQRAEEIFGELFGKIVEMYKLFREIDFSLIVGIRFFDGADLVAKLMSNLSVDLEHRRVEFQA